jgi:preprotein translocase subunit SecB
MSESENTGDNGQAQDADRAQVQFRIERVFLKDSSFESPNSPEVFIKQWRPEIKVDINTRATGLGEDLQEVILSATVTATLEENMVAFIVEIQQGGIFLIQGAEPNQLSQIIGIACPNTLFPYLREAMDNLVVKGGFPPLQLAQVNFEALYVKALQEHERAGEAEQKDDSDVTTH